MEGRERVGGRREGVGSQLSTKGGQWGRREAGEICEGVKELSGAGEKQGVL